MRAILFCHGLESAPQGAKYHAMVERGLQVQAPDFRGMALAARVEHLLDILRRRDDAPLLVGSSYGGIAALCAAILHQRGGGALSELILCAPALARAEAPADTLELVAPAPTTIVHGTLDEVIPIEVSRSFAEGNALVSLLEVEDGHRLAASLPIICDLVERAASKAL